MTGPIATARCELVPLGSTLASELAAGRTDGVRPGAGWPHQDTLVVVHAALALDWPTWLVRLASTGEVIGECGLKGHPDPNGAVEIGYGLAAAYRGCGYGREMVAGLLDWLAGRGDVHRVVAEVAVGNLPSRRLVAGLGFTIDRTSDDYIYYARELG